MVNGWDSLTVAKKTGGSERLYRGIKNLKEVVIKASGLEPEAGTQLIIDAVSPFIRHRFGKETAFIKRDLAKTTVLMRVYNIWSKVDLNDIPLAYSTSGISLSTIHGAKGQEWKYVFLINVVEKYLPFYFMGKTDLDEERRMFYVAITMASEKLYIIHSPVIDTKFPSKGKPKRGKQGLVFDEESTFITSYKNHMKRVK